MIADADYQAQPTEVATILVNLQRVGDEFKTISGSPFSSALLNTIVKLLPSIRDASQSFLQDLNLQAAKANEEANLWADPDKYPDLQDAQDVSTDTKIFDESSMTVYQYM